jgi:hypothetical protein
MANPQVGMRVRLKMPVGKADDPGRLEAGAEGVIDEVVTAETEGAGDSERDCVVVAFDNGRRWSHPIVGQALHEVVAAHVAEDPQAAEHQEELQGGALGACGWDEVLEVVE